MRPPPLSTLFPYTTLFRSASLRAAATVRRTRPHRSISYDMSSEKRRSPELPVFTFGVRKGRLAERSEEHTSELQSHSDLVCRLLLEKKKKAHRFSNAYK